MKNLPLTAEQAETLNNYIAHLHAEIAHKDALISDLIQRIVS